MKIALLQILPTGSLNGNREKGVEACRKAKVLGADIALFPEMWSNGYDIPEDAEALQRAAVPADGEFVSGFGKLAAELNMAIAITFLEKTEKRPRNAVILFDRHGRRLYTYAKVHTCDFGDECRLDAGEDFFVASLDTEEGTVQVGSMICYDREFPESARILMLKGAELILTPNACPMEINRLSQLRGRAYENMTAIATCNYPSPHPDCNGHSTVFDGVAYLPELSGCCVCGREDPDRFSIADGTLECAGCRASDGVRMPLSPASLAAMRYIVSCPDKKLFSFTLTGAAEKELCDAAESYLLTQLERSFYTLDFYKSLLVE